MDGLTLHDAMASCPDESTWVWAVTARTVGWKAEGGGTGPERDTLCQDRRRQNNDAVPLLQVVITSSSHYCDRKGGQRNACNDDRKTGSIYPSRSVKGGITAVKLAAFTRSVKGGTTAVKGPA